MKYTATKRFRQSKPALEDATEADLRSLCKYHEAVTIAPNTRVFTYANNDLAVVFHGTEIATFHENGSVTLNSGGYRTVTTKQRLNALLKHRNVHIWQESHVWFFTGPTVSGEFQDGVRVPS